MSEEPNTDGAKQNRNLLIGVGIFILVIFCVIVAIALFTRQNNQTEITPTLQATADTIVLTPTATTQGSAIDPVWAQMQETGTMIVGTSADYPPFEYYTKDFQLDGFDIALIKAIGQKLGLTVEIKDMAFDGLGNALQVNQINVAIAALAVTEQREEVADFSHIYFISTDAALAANDSSIMINSADDLMPYQIGVESGSIYENFVQTNFINTERKPASSLHVYPRMDQALAELESGVTDLVLLDKAAAEVAVAERGFKIAGSDHNQLQLAMAMPQDSFMVQSEINRALAELQADGTVAELVKTYFDIEQEVLPPIPTPDPTLPTPTPGVPQGCIDSMQYVSDLSYDDQNFKNIPQVPAGTDFQKGWRVRNTGTCTWSSEYSLTPVEGNNAAARMGGTPIFVENAVAPGQTYDFWANLTAPLKSGTYIEYWTMRNADGVLFGDKVWVAITVAGAPTQTPKPTQTPTAEIKFTADPETINQGECSTLYWETENIQAVYVYPEGEDWQNYGVPGDGSQEVCPTTTTTYIMRVLMRDGSVVYREVTVYVIPNPDAPTITRFTVEPMYQITEGECVVITWAVEGDVDTVTIWRNDVVIRANAPYSGKMQDCPPDTGQYVYKLEAKGPGGNSAASQAIQVVPQATATVQPTNTPTPVVIDTATPTVEPGLPTNTPAPTKTTAPTPTNVPPTATTESPTATSIPPTPTPIPDPVIYSFSATPSQVEVGGCVTVAWSVGGSTTNVTLYKNGREVLTGAPLRDSVDDCDLTEVGTVTYSIVASNDVGGSSSADASVEVVDSTPDNPLVGTSWGLVSYALNGTETAVIEGTTISASFSDSSIDGTAGCNEYSASYKVDGSNISIGTPITSQILCSEPEGIMDQESAYLRLLPTAATYQTSNGQLSISDSSGQVILKYSQLVATPR